MRASESIFPQRIIIRGFTPSEVATHGRHLHKEIKFNFGVFHDTFKKKTSLYKSVPRHVGYN